jgi:hypothetical protein
MSTRSEWNGNSLYAGIAKSLETIAAAGCSPASIYLSAAARQLAGRMPRYARWLCHALNSKSRHDKTPHRVWTGQSTLANIVRDGNRICKPETLKHEEIVNNSANCIAAPLSNRNYEKKIIDMRIRLIKFVSRLA